MLGSYIAWKLCRGSPEGGSQGGTCEGGHSASRLIGLILPRDELLPSRPKTPPVDWIRRGSETEATLD